MKKILSHFKTLMVCGAVLSGAFGLTVSSTAFAQNKPTVSKAAAKPLQAAQEAVQSKQYQVALQRLREVEALPALNAYDQHLINELRGYALVRLNNYGEAARALEAGLSTGFLEQSEVSSRVKALTQLYYQVKNYDKAIEFGNRAIKGGYADDDIQTTVGQSYYVKGDYSNARRFFDSYVDAQISRGQMPKELALQLAMSSCLKLKNNACVTESLERLVAYYPKTEYWQNLMYSLFQALDPADKNSSAVLLHVYRLASEVDVLRTEDYTEMAWLAKDLGSPGEAQRVLEKGIDKKVFKDQRELERNKRLLEAAKRDASTDQKTLAKEEAAAKASRTGDKDVSLGLAYLSYQQYPKAVEALSRGLKKGGVRNELNARMLLGIAQLKAGQKDEAITTFRSVKGDPTFERVANLWALHARQA